MRPGIERTGQLEEQRIDRALGGALERAAERAERLEAGPDRRDDERLAASSPRIR